MPPPVQNIGFPETASRATLILPCGTGKTRVSARVMLELAPEANDLGIVLVPSIALISQVRREYLGYLHSIGRTARVLAVCSDKTAGHVEEKDLGKPDPDPTLDDGQVRVADVDCVVAQTEAAVGKWLAVESDGLRIIFSTYQSAHHTAKALRATKQYASVMVMDEAHRTAQLKPAKGKTRAERLRKFTLCHDQNEFPARYRLYQTATPRVYSEKDMRRVNRGTQKWAVDSMADQTVFGPEAYRLPYPKAVKDGLLSDYRIIAIAVHAQAWDEARKIIENLDDHPTNVRGVTQFEAVSWVIYGSVLAGAVRGLSNRPITRSLAFLNLVRHSRKMANWLSSDEGRSAVDRYTNPGGANPPAPRYIVEHLDAGHTVVERRRALRDLKGGSRTAPRGISNVGIFGEGVDSPNLDAVALLAPRRSPTEIIQIVGRVMRRSPDKSLGYVLVPVPLPRGLDAETSLAVGKLGDEWKALGETLQALRAHDGRIEDEIQHMLQIHVPSDPEPDRDHLVVIQPSPNGDPIVGIWRGPRGSVEDAVARAGVSPWSKGCPPIQRHLTEKKGFHWHAPVAEDSPAASDRRTAAEQLDQVRTALEEHLAVFVVQRRKEGLSSETQGAIAAPDGTVDVSTTLTRARRAAAQRDPLKRTPRRRTRPSKRRVDTVLEVPPVYLRLGPERDPRVEVMELSGLRGNSERDFNLLMEPVQRVSSHLREERLEDRLRAVLGMEHMKETDVHADACKVAALILLNATLLHARLERAGGRVAQLVRHGNLASAQHQPDPVAVLRRAWTAVLAQDYAPIFKPALALLNALDRFDAVAGVRQALRSLAAWSAQNADTYASMGMEYAGELFSRVLGHQASDGAYFTRQPAARLLAELTLDATGATDWNNRATWDRLKMVDLACGSGTLLNAYLEAIKDRIRAEGGQEADTRAFHKFAVENLITGLDINPISLQLAAGRLTLGHLNVDYRRMSLYTLPYGPQAGGPFMLGSLDLLTVPSLHRPGTSDMDDASLLPPSHPVVNGAVPTAVRTCRVIIMNPPFGSKRKRGAKFKKIDSDAMNARELVLRDSVARRDPEAAAIFDADSVSPLFSVLGEQLLPTHDGIFAKVMPVSACTNASGVRERRFLSSRFHVKYILCCHDPKNPNLSSYATSNDCMIIATRHQSNEPTRFVNLRRFPSTVAHVKHVVRALYEDQAELVGAECRWPQALMRSGDWSPVQWFSPDLARAALDLGRVNGLCNLKRLYRLGPVGRRVHDAFRRLTGSTGEGKNAIRIFDSISADLRQTLFSEPEASWTPDPSQPGKVQSYLAQRGWLMLASFGDTPRSITTAVFHSDRHLGSGYVPAITDTLDQAKALCIIWNSTPVLLQLLNRRAKKLQVVNWSKVHLESVRIPANIQRAQIQTRLVELCSRLATRQMKPWAEADSDPVRAEIDRVAAELFGIPEERVAEWRRLLVREPNIANRVVD